MDATIILSSIGGVIALISAVWVIFRAIIRAVGALKDNTVALTKVEKTLTEITVQVNKHDIEIAVLNDRTTRP